MFLEGVVEGFYGRSWSWSARYAWIKVLAGVTKQACYIYAPKSEKYLASAWREPWPADEWEALSQFSAYCLEKGVRFGIGLSPRDIECNKTDLSALRTKIKHLATLKPQVFCLLCDDAEPIADTAQSQATLVEVAIEALDESTLLLFCPTWYCLDSRLIELYGDPPEAYYEDIGAALPSNVGILWTGEQVCSRHHRAEHWHDISARLGRKPVLWDNSVANDGKKICQYLKLSPFATEWCHLRQWTSGVLLNPMNQPYAAQLSFTHLIDCLDNKETRNQNTHQVLWQQTLQRAYTKELVQYLNRDSQLFCDIGLDSLSPAERKKIEGEYRALNDPFATDIADWLAGEYIFDADCLT